MDPQPYLLSERKWELGSPHQNCHQQQRHKGHSSATEAAHVAAPWRGVRRNGDRGWIRNLWESDKLISICLKMYMYICACVYVCINIHLYVYIYICISLPMYDVCVYCIYIYLYAVYILMQVDICIWANPRISSKRKVWHQENNPQNHHVEYTECVVIFLWLDFSVRVVANWGLWAIWNIARICKDVLHFHHCWFRLL